MASQISTGSPKMNRKALPSLKINNDSSDKRIVSRAPAKPASSKLSVAMPLQSNNLSNLQPTQGQELNKPNDKVADAANSLGKVLAHLRQNETPKNNTDDAGDRKTSDSIVLDKLLNDLNSQNQALKQQEKDLREATNCDNIDLAGRISNSDMNNGSLNVSASKQPPLAGKFEESEVVRVKKELEAARTVIMRQEHELAESRNLKHTMEQAMDQYEPDQSVYLSKLQDADAITQSSFNASARPFTSRSEPSWTLDDAHPEQSVLNTNTVRGRTIFGNQSQFGHAEHTYGNTGVPYANSRGQQLPSPSFTTSGGQASPMDSTFGNRVFSGPSNTSYGIDERMLNDYDGGNQYPGLRRTVRSNSTLIDPLSPVLTAGMGLAPVNVANPYGYGGRAYGQVPVSPLSPDFPPTAGMTMIPTSMANGNTYITPLEPMNYRRLLDKSVSCDWKYIVDKIVCNNDQQASIFLQQKLKVGTAEQKFEIVESIVNQAYPLMINRFGNFLVQRCFEHGTPEQIIAIANAIHGNVISLSMDPFGCHVIQKAFDSVPEDHKADMVRELLRRIPDTVIHRYACHVWQKLFELRWSGEPPQIMLKVNEALRGMWHEVALGETGSLVVQNIFENCVEEEKRPAIEEVVASIDLIAHGQFGNWCIQHLCEHGSPPDKRRVIDHILTNSYSYSIDQFASKVVEKCLKIDGPDFLERYLSVITTSRPDRPRIPLIDIAGDQYGNYLIQWILMNTHQHQREQVAIHIRKHMVSLRGSKFGSRVAMLCSNPAAATRPGPPAALVNPYGAPGQPARNGWTRYR